MAQEADFKQFEQFIKAWQDSAKEFDDFLKKFLLEMAQRAISKIKPNTPVDTGALRNMWGVGSQKLALKSSGEKWSEKKGQYQETYTIDPENSTVASIDVVGNNLEVVIWNASDYASFIEYGHRRVDGSWREGHFMMTIGIAEVQRQMPARFEKALKEYLARKGAV